MIEPTDGMLNAFRDAWMASMQSDPRSGDPERIADRAGLAAVLAIVERDYRTEPRPPWERAPRCPVVNDRCPGNANGWICDEPCNPDGTP